MRLKNQKIQSEKRETEIEFVFEVLLVNVLLLTVISAFAWLAHFVLTDNSSLNAVLRGGFLP